MKHLPHIAILAVLMACSSSRPAAKAVADPQSDLARMASDAVLWQHTSAEAFRLYQQGYELARIRLAENLRLADKRPPAVIVDIDETVLDNSPYQVEAIRRGRTFDQNEWRAWTDRAAAKASPGALDFLLFAKDQGVEVFYVTNRDVREKASTLKNLQELGFPDADEDHLRLMEGTSDKTDRRERIRNDYQVVLLVGDQLRDFDERFKDRTTDYGKGLVEALRDSLSRYFILLPNPMYGTYRDAIQGKGTDAEKLARMRLWFEQNGH